MLKRLLTIGGYSLLALIVLTVVPLIAAQLGLTDAQWQRPLAESQSGLLLWRLALYTAMAWLWLDLLRHARNTEHALFVTRLGCMSLLLITAIELLKA